MTYDRLKTDDLRGATQTDYLIALDADLRVIDGDATIYDEPGFPVVELARSLLIWLESPERGDFAFDSMSFEEVGVVSIRESAFGWAFSSIFAPETLAAPVGWAEVERYCRAFIAKVEEDLGTLGLDPAAVIRK